MSLYRFVGPGLLLFFDQLIVSVAGWLYWIVISRLTVTSEIGNATTITNLVILVSTFAQLGLEYPLLKNSSVQRSQILGTILVIELIITIALVPVVIHVVNVLYYGSLQDFALIAVGMFLLSSLSFVARFALLGISDARSVLMITLAGTATKLGLGYTLVSIGFGAFGMLLALLIETLLEGALALGVCRKRFSFRIGSLEYFKKNVKDGLVNTPSKLSKMIILSLSIVLLASFGVNSSEVGIFYVAIIISVVAGSLASSMAYMVIPASSGSKNDLSTDSLRISLSLTAPLIAALIVAPKSILSVIGPEYASAEIILLVLSIGILPSSIAINAISKFNYLGKSKELITIGSIQILAFLIPFIFLVPLYGTLGAAVSILIAFVGSSIPSIIWSERISMKYIGNSAFAIISGFTLGYVVGIIFDGIHPAVQILISTGAALAVVLALKNTTAREIGQLVRDVLRKS
jgi:O-antigen/teichoic acid export membrane protein